MRLFIVCHSIECQHELQLASRDTMSVFSVLPMALNTNYFPMSEMGNISQQTIFNSFLVPTSILWALNATGISLCLFWAHVVIHEASSFPHGALRDRGWASDGNPKRKKEKNIKVQIDIKRKHNTTKHIFLHMLLKMYVSISHRNALSLKKGW